jgi:aspartate aminotransferase-like enzyme
MPHMFVPGPVDVDADILNAQTQPMLPHRSPEFEDLFQRATVKTQQLFYTTGRVFVFSSSGTGLQEAAVRNFASERVLSCVNGAFGSRWYDVAVSNGLQADKLEAAWGQPVTAQMVAEKLGEHPYDIITIVHNETSTGLENPVEEIAEAVRHTSPDTLVCVDAVSSLGGTKIETDAWGLDMVLTSSQKCLALPPGLALAAVSDRAMKRAEEVLHRGWYFDLLRMEKHRLKDSTPATPAISLIYALDTQLEHILKEGLEKRYARHSAMAKRIHSWALERGFSLFAQDGFRSQTVTTLKNLLELDIQDLNRCLLESGLRIANGYGILKNETFRIAHMGETRMEDLDMLLEEIDKYIGA